MLDIGARSALCSQLSWQIRHGWDRERSLTAWHKQHPDISDDIFDELYRFAKRGCKLCDALKDPFCTGTLRELWTKQS
jgi:hypothetical protein